MPDDLATRSASQIIVLDTVQPVGTSSIKGAKFLDLDFDGFRDGNEPGIAGVRVYIDVNGNNQFDNAEPFRITDQFGGYRFDGLAPSNPADPNTFYRIREDKLRNDIPAPPGVPLILPTTWQTVPETTQVDNPLLQNPDPRGIDVILGRNQLWSGADIGNGPFFSLQILKIFDTNANGLADPGEPPLPDIPFWLDFNNNGEINAATEVFYTGGGLVNPTEQVGFVTIGNVPPGTYPLRELIDARFFPPGQTVYSDAIPDPNLPPYTGLPPYPIQTAGDQLVDVPGDRPGGGSNNGVSVLFPIPTAFIEVLPNNPVMLTPEQISAGVGGVGRAAAEVGEPSREAAQIGNAPPTLSAFKFNDVNGNGIQESNEPPIPGVTIYIDTNNNGVPDEGEAAGVTDGAGRVNFGVVPPGTYTVAEVVPAGFSPTTPNPVAVNVGSADAVVSFGNAPPGMIMGVKFLDLDRDGIRDGDEPGLQGYQIYIDSNGNEVLDPGEINTLSDQDGNWMFNSLPEGLYKIREVQQPGIIQTTQPLDIQLAQGHTWGTAQIGNFPLNDLVIIKFEDLNRSGTQDAGEPLLEGIPFILDLNQNGRRDGNEPFTTTGSNGTAIFRNLVPGNYPVFELLDQTPVGLQIPTGPNPLIVGVPGPISAPAGSIPDPPRTIPEGEVAAIRHATDILLDGGATVPAEAADAALVVPGESGSAIDPNLLALPEEEDLGIVAAATDPLAFSFI